MRLDELSLKMLLITKLSHRLVLATAIAAAILGVPGTLLWLMTFWFERDYIADGGRCWRASSHSLRPTSWCFFSRTGILRCRLLRGLRIAPLANIWFFSAVAVLGTVLSTGSLRIVVCIARHQ